MEKYRRRIALSAAGVYDNKKGIARRGGEKEKTMSKAVVFMAPGLEECEGLIVVDILRRAGVEVTMASITENLSLTSAHGLQFQADALAADVNYADADMVVLPGGMPGTLHLGACPVVQEQCRAFAAAGKWVAAICAAPGVLGGLGLLQGKAATSHPAHEDKLVGAAVTHAECTVDGNIITGRGLGAAIPFALELAARLEGQEKADAIRAAICYEH